MSLFFVVRLEDNGLVGEDDGDFAWRSTTVAFGYRTIGFVSDVQVDGYSGQKKAIITRDDFALPPRLAEPLGIMLYRVCGIGMRETDCDFGEAFCDLEPLINHLFYRSDADALLRKIRAVIATIQQSKKVGA